MTLFLVSRFSVSIDALIRGLYAIAPHQAPFAILDIRSYLLGDQLPSEPQIEEKCFHTISSDASQPLRLCARCWHRAIRWTGVSAIQSLALNSKSRLPCAIAADAQALAAQIGLKRLDTRALI